MPNFQVISIAIATFILILNVATPINAITPNDIQSPQAWVQDQADLLTPETELKLNEMIAQLEQRNGSEIAIVTVTETQPSKTPKDFATELFNTWKIGKSDVNNGVLFLISKADRRVEIEVGKGLTTVLPNMQVNRIINRAVTPSVKQGNFDGGTIAGTQSLIDVLWNQTVVVSAQRSKKSFSSAPTASLPQRSPNPIAPAVVDRNSGDQSSDAYAVLGGIATIAGMFALVGGTIIGIAYLIWGRTSSSPPLQNPDPTPPTERYRGFGGGGFSRRSADDYHYDISPTPIDTRSPSPHNQSSNHYSSDSSNSSWSSSDSTSSGSSSSDWGGGSSDGGGSGGDW